MPDQVLETDVAIIGGGIAGIAAAHELLDHGRRVLVLDRDVPERLGGLAKESFGGIFLVGTPHQRFVGARDTPELALRDWHAFAGFGDEDLWPRRWAEQYVYRCHDDVYRWLRDRSVRFFPVVHWVERGLFAPGNSVPRFHMVWGTGHGLVEALVGHLHAHDQATRLELRFRHHVTDLLTTGGRVTGVRGRTEDTGEPFEVRADHVIVAAGGICGDVERVKRSWYAPWGRPPDVLLNGSHRYADGDMHDAAETLGAHVTHMDKQWHYAAGVHHPNPDGLANKGLSIVPPKSALWVNYRGERIGPMPLVSGFDTRYLVEQVCRQDEAYSWQIMNWKIAAKELAVSGSEYNDAIREKKLLSFLTTVLRGNRRLVEDLIATCPDFVVASSLDELVDAMNALTGTEDVDRDVLRDAVTRYDASIERGPAFHNDEQLRRIAHLRRYRGDRTRTCKYQRILDDDAMPLVAIREFILSRKSLGGIQTDLECRVLSRPGDGPQEPIPGLYAVGEAAGFGGGGIHGLRALEGTFLGSCILTGRLASRHIAGAS